MLRSTVCFALALSAAPAMGQEIAISGPGTASCAVYTGDRSLRINADGWILGFFTGMNVKNDNHIVGKAGDARGIVAEVARACRDSPASTLYAATRRVYERLSTGG